MNSAFDQVANNYDLYFSQSQIGLAQREIVYRYLIKNLPENKTLSILELNCGTGEDAIFFAKKRCTVLATDISINMLNIAKQKVDSEKLNDNIKFKQVDIVQIENENFEHKFDLIFSNFGGLNCVDRSGLEKFSHSIKKYLNNSGRLIFIIMSDSCIWEKFYFLIKMKFKESRRRKIKSGIQVNLNGSSVKTYYYSPKEVEKIFSHSFNILSQKPIGFFIPPSYLEKFFRHKSKTFNFLKNLESIFSNFSFLSSYSDHFLVDFQVKQ
jgi:ubiquinone/menaquinone biosynthesis C-methylase UbiE